ncbi:hypothetical protein [Achromobacter animicus]|uniref:hypothetical protein n=1 Tax=Achromobacter animicus TaxID=1389935 RepID=UPI00345EC3AB
MNFVSYSLTTEDLIRNFDNLLKRFRDLRERTGSGAPIENTKLWTYRKNLDSLNQMDPLDAAALVGIVNKYCSINSLFDVGEDIKIPEQKLLDLLYGRYLLQDEDEEYNNTFFELAMALRISQSMGNEGGIDLSTDCDVIWYDKDLAIECKYLHSEKKFRKELSKALDQLERRLSDGLANMGLVAFDLSNLVDHKIIFEFSRSTFYAFVKNYECLIERRSIFAQGISEEGVPMSVIQDRNFIKILTSFASHQLEAVFYRNFKKSELSKLSHNKVGVIFQLNISLLFEYQGEVIPIPSRAMSYYINKNINENKRDRVQKLIHSLATGI